MESSTISRGMVEDAETSERTAGARLRAKQEALQKEDFAGELSKIGGAAEDVQRKVSSLRQVSIASWARPSAFYLVRQHRKKIADILEPFLSISSHCLQE